MFMIFNCGIVIKKILETQLNPVIRSKILIIYTKIGKKIRDKAIILIGFAG